MVKKYLDYLRYELNRAELTVNAYEMDICQFQDWIVSKNSEAIIKPVKEAEKSKDDGEETKIDFKLVTASDVRSWLGELAKKGDSPRTLRRKIISLRSLFKWMMKNGEITVSPLQKIPLPKIPKPLPNFIKPQEIEVAIETASDLSVDDSPLKPLILEMLYTLGIRRAELIALNDSDVSFSKGEIKVTGKRSKQRVVPVPQALLEKIKSWQSYRDNEIESAADKGASSDSPLLVVKGKRITASQVYHVVKDSLATSTAKKKSPHALRHSFASGMLNGGADIDAVREFLGHASLATTQIYTHISLNEIKKAYSTAHPRSNNKK